MIKYFEVFFDHYEFDWSICIKGIRQPTVKEANNFLSEDTKKFGKVTRVYPISHECATALFDCDNEENWPIFGIKEMWGLA